MKRSGNRKTDLEQEFNVTILANTTHFKCDGTKNFTKRLSNIEDARAACLSFGADWSVKKEGSGSLICTKGSTGAGQNCNSIDTWRAVVWEDGYGDPQDTATDGKFSTHAGYYYGGTDPCQYGDNLGEGYPWKGNLFYKVAFQCGQSCTTKIS